MMMSEYNGKILTDLYIKVIILDVRVCGYKNPPSKMSYCGRQWNVMLRHPFKMGLTQQLWGEWSADTLSNIMCTKTFWSLPVIGEKWHFSAFNGYFLIMNRNEHFFISLFSYVKNYLISIRCLFIFFDYFSIELVVFSILTCRPSLYIRELTFYLHCKLSFTFLVCHLSFDSVHGGSVERTDSYKSELARTLWLKHMHSIG